MINRFLIVVFTLVTLQLSAETNPKMTKEFCEILGMLGEYNGRVGFFPNTNEPNDSIVEYFYPHEKELASRFKKLIKTYEKETMQNFPIYEKIGRQGHIYLYSKTLRLMINSLYTPINNNIATLDKLVILNESDDLIYSYLKGVYCRFGNGNHISIANGIFKLQTVYEAMKSLNIGDLKLYKSVEDYTPCNYILTFQRTSKLQERLNLNQTELMINNKMYEEIKRKN